MLDADPRSRDSTSDPDRLVLLRPPRYEPDSVSYQQLAASMTMRGAREGLVVVWEIRSDEGLPNLPDHKRSVLLRRPATIELVVTHPRVPCERLPTCRANVQELLRPFRPGMIRPGALNGHTAELRMALAHPSGDLAAQIVDLLLRRGLVMDAVVQHLAGRILSSTLGEVEDLRLGVRHTWDEREVERAFAMAGAPAPARWVRIARAIRFVIAYSGRDMDAAYAARRAGGLDLEAVLHELKTLTGIEPRELVLRLGWRWVLEAWIQREVSEGRVSDDQRGRVVAMGRSAGNDVPYSEFGSGRVHLYSAADA